MSFTLRAFRRVTPTLPTSTGEPEPAHDKVSGRVGFDARGNAVWEWRTADKGFVRDASTTLVRKLDVPQLSIETTAIARRRQAPQVERQAATAGSARLAAPLPMGAGGGSNPYNRNGEYAAKSAPAHRSPPRQQSRIIVTSRSKPGLLDRLQEWMGARPRSRR